MKHDLVLVNPPITLEERYGSFASVGSQAAPLGLCYLASSARKQGCTHLVDAATLTGAIVVALGHVNVGLFASDDAMRDLVLAAAPDILAQVKQPFDPKGKPQQVTDVLFTTFVIQ